MAEDFANNGIDEVWALLVAAQTARRLGYENTAAELELIIERSRSDSSNETGRPGTHQTGLQRGASAVTHTGSSKKKG